MAKSLHEYTIDELLAEVRSRIAHVPSNAAQPDYACPAGHNFGHYTSSGCPRIIFTNAEFADNFYV